MFAANTSSSRLNTTENTQDCIFVRYEDFAPTDLKRAFVCVCAGKNIANNTKHEIYRIYL